MQSAPAIESLRDVVAGTGLAEPRSSGVVLVSGGADSACVAAALVALCGPASIAAIHVNYALRLDSDEDERAARALCAQRRIDLHVDRPELGEGNLQARARDARYGAAERLRERLGADWIATGHTRTDIAETMLYRLAVSPGTRPLLGLAPRNGRVIRPLHSVSRAETRAIAVAAPLPFRDDPTNASARYARNRIRAEVLPVLTEIGAEAERNLAATHAELHVPLNRARAAAVCRLAQNPEGGVVALGGGVEARCEAGLVRFALAAGEPEGGEESLQPVMMSVPGRARFGDWELIAELSEAVTEEPGPRLATLDAAALGSRLEGRGWRRGDRIRPLGLDGSKSLQDLFTDHGVPRSERARIPVVTVGGRVAWVAGVAVSEEFRLGERSSGVAVIRARPAA